MRVFPGGDCPPRGIRNRRAVGRDIAESAAGDKKATVDPGAWIDARFTGRGMIPGAGAGALRRQQVLEDSLEWQANRMARQQAVSVTTLVWQACAMPSGSVTIAIRRKRHRADFL